LKNSHVSITLFHFGPPYWPKKSWNISYRKVVTQGTTKYSALNSACLGCFKLKFDFSLHKEWPSYSTSQDWILPLKFTYFILQGTWSTVAYFYGPIACMLLVNSFFFSLTLVSLYRVQKSINSERTVQLWRSQSQGKRHLGQVKER
jgi:hypothetical protein